METSSATLTASLMADVSKMAGVVKNLAFKPFSGMTLRLKLDFHASFRVGSSEERWADLSKAQRYKRLQKQFAQLCCGKASDPRAEEWKSGVAFCTSV